MQFKHVSKKYRLGTGTTSLRKTLSHTLGRLVRDRTSANGAKGVLWALKDVSFALERGQALGIVGPNGAGKTTVLRLLSNITQPTSGTIDINGRISALIELGAGFHPDLSGRENLYLNAAILGISRQEMAAKYDSILEFSGLGEFMDTPVKRYSSGMYVRLGFSVAAHVEPDLLLVDEVLAVGDAAFQRKCVERIGELRQRGTTIVFVSHNMNLVRSVCDKGLFLVKGQVRALGSALEALRAYETHLHSSEESVVANLNPTYQSLGLDQTPAEITDVELLNDSDQRTDDFSYTDNVQVRVSYRTQERIHSPSLLARIIRSDGTTCCEIRTRNDQIWLPDLEGSGQVSFGIEPLQLASGTYLIEVRLQDTFGAANLAAGQSAWFHVSGPGVTVVYEYGGVYVPQVRWSFAPNQPPLEQGRSLTLAKGEGQ